jgi:hypothetical protein
MQIVPMLPRDPTEARQVLKLADSLVDKFLAADDQPPPKPTVIDNT